MLGRFSTVFQNAVDALAPPPPLHEDFAYHWKRLMKHYLDVTKSRQVPIELTNLPSHIDQLLKILLKEEEGNENGSMGPCLEYLLQHSLLDLLVTLAETDDPPGMRQHVLTFISKFLSQIRAPVVGHTSVFPPLQRMVSACDGSTPTATESDEIHFLLGLTALIRRNPQLLPIFTTPQSVESVRRGSCSSDASSQFSMLTGGSDCNHSASHTPPPVNNPLFSTPLTTSVKAKSVRLVPPEVAEPQTDGHSEDSRSLATDASMAAPQQPDTSFPLMDAILSYLDSPDSKVRVKACQCLMLLVSLPDERLAATIAHDSLTCVSLASRLADLYSHIPYNTEPNHIEDLRVSWGLDVPLSPCLNCEGCRQLISFLSWFDFCNQVVSECHPTIGDALCKAIKERFLEDMFPADTLSSILNLAVIAKCFNMASCPKLCDALCVWMAGEEAVRLSPGVSPHPILNSLLTNWSHSDPRVVIETLRLFELVLGKGNEHLMTSLIYIYLIDRTYLEHIPDKDDVELVNGEVTPEINEVIMSYLSIVPYELRSGAESGYEQYVSESQRQYAEVVATRENWQGLLASIPLPPRDHFYEGPFLRTLFQTIRNIPNQEYRVNLELTAIVSQLALDPVPLMGEYLLNSRTRCRAVAHTLVSCLRLVATSLAGPVTANLDYRRLLKETREHLLTGTHYPHYEWSGVYECSIVLEELCKELAAIAYVKHKHEINSPEPPS